MDNSRTNAISVKSGAASTALCGLATMIAFRDWGVEYLAVGGVLVALGLALYRAPRLAPAALLLLLAWTVWCGYLVIPEMAERFAVSYPLIFGAASVVQLGRFIWHGSDSSQSTAAV